MICAASHLLMQPSFLPLKMAKKRTKQVGVVQLEIACVASCGIFPRNVDRARTAISCSKVLKVCATYFLPSRGIRRMLISRVKKTLTTGHEDPPPFFLFYHFFTKFNIAFSRLF